MPRARKCVYNSWTVTDMVRFYLASFIPYSNWDQCQRHATASIIYKLDLICVRLYLAISRNSVHSQSYPALTYNVKFVSLLVDCLIEPFPINDLRLFPMATDRVLQAQNGSDPPMALCLFALLSWYRDVRGERPSSSQAGSRPHIYDGSPADFKHVGQRTTGAPYRKSK